MTIQREQDLLSQIVGHGEQVAQLRGLIHQGAMPHAMIFSGPSGIGKRTTALACAGELMCDNRTLGDHQLSSDDEHGATRALVRAGNHPDLHVAVREEGKKDISVETIRELRDRLHLKPYLGRAVTVVIDEAELMNSSAYNALLKTLEEPNDATFLFLITNRLHALPETIRSRCQAMHFSTLAPQALEQILANLVGDTALDQATLQELARLCGDSLEKLSLSAFVQPRQFGQSSIQTKGLEAHLREQLALFSSLNRDIESLIGSQDLARALSVASTVSATKGNESVFWSTLRQALHRRMVAKPTAALADVLAHVLDAEQLGLQRNVNQTVLASEALCRATTLSL